MNDIRIALINDHPLVLEGLRALLRPHASVEVVELDAVTDTAQQVDLALLDIYSQSDPLPEAIRRRVMNPQIGKVVVYAWQMDERMVNDALGAGADGVVSKKLAAPDLVDSLVRLAKGEKVVSQQGQIDAGEADDLASSNPGKGRNWPGRDAGLSMREAEMITLICRGLSNEQISDQLYLSPNSVKSYIRAAYQKIGASSRSQAVIWGIDHGLRPEPARRQV